MAVDKQMEEAFINMKGILFRIDERIKTVVDSQMYLTERFDKFMISYNDLVQRVARLETILNSSGKTVDEVEDNYYTLKDRVHIIEVNHDIIKQYEDSIIKLSQRITELESLTKIHSFKWDTWSGRIQWFSKVLFKCAWVLGMGWLLYKFGLGGVNFAP